MRSERKPGVTRVEVGTGGMPAIYTRRDGGRSGDGGQAVSCVWDEVG